MIDLKSAGKGSDKTILACILLVLSLVICNLVFINSSGWAHVGWSILGYASLVLIYKLARLKPDDIGLSPRNFKLGLKYGGYTVLVILLGFLMVFLIHKTLFHDQRYHHSLATALYASIILLPLKTVFFEELAFRGIFPAILVKLKKSRRFASLVSSLAFGLWHVGSAPKTGTHTIGSVAIPNILTVLAIVAVTTLAGLFFCELRWRSKSLVAPLIAHWFINGFAIVLASLSWT